MKVKDNVYALESTRGNYAYLVRGAETVLIDTGRPGQGKGICRELESLSVKPETIRHILLTHHDVDHIGNAAQLQRLTRAQLWAPAADIPYINGTAARPGVKKYLTSIFRIECPGNIRAYPDNLQVGPIGVIPTPGHTPGHVCLLYQDVLFAGDLVQNRLGILSHLPAFFIWDKALLLESIRTVAQLPYRWLCPAHGAPMERDNQLEQFA